MRDWLELAARGEELPLAPEPYDGNLAPIYTCARLGRRDGIKLLLAAGWDLNRHGEGFSAAMACPEMREFLLSLGARPEMGDVYGQTPLFQADLARARTWLEFGVEVNHQDREGRTALWIAANRNRFELVDLLLNFGADPNLADAEGVTPLMKAATRRVRRRLLEGGARAEEAVFRWLCNRPEGLIQLIEYLEPALVPMEFRLWHRFWMRQRASFEALCTQNLQDLPIDRPVFQGQSVLWWAARLGSLNCCQLLLERGWSPRRSDRNGRTPLHAAIHSGRPKVVSCLLKASGSPDRLARELALKRGDPNVMALLKQR